ncbi:MAG: hypothetical protein K0R38_4694 [Polyangiaceae bacterium]|nr:hypothetical protein [Polyangiaceae bacterium]
MTALASSYRLFWLHFSVACALWAVACERDTSVLFDDSEAVAGTGTDAPRAGASNDTGGEGGSDSAAGGDTSGQSGADWGGNAGAPSGGKGSAGRAGNPAAGEAGGGGKGSAGSEAGAGKSGGGAGGTGGSAQPDPDPVTVTIREVVDANIASCRPLENFGNEPRLTVDANGSGVGKCVYQGLFGFDLGALPAGSKVSEATLTLHCVNAGDQVSFSYAKEAWQEGTVRWSQRPELGAELGRVSCTGSGAVELPLTSAVAAWISGEHAPHGIYLTAEGSNGTDFATSEAEDQDARPALRVTYIGGG